MIETDLSDVALDSSSHHEETRWSILDSDPDDGAILHLVSVSIIDTGDIPILGVSEISKLIANPPVASEQEAPPVSTTEAEDPFASALENSRELIKDRLMRLSWQDMQFLVAGILRSMGYKTKVSPEGADRGKDIIASPDGLGLEQPRIFVEVKHRKGQKIGGPHIRTFIGGRDAQHDRCLYVSTGGFSSDGKMEAERSRVPLTLIDPDDLVALLLDNYETCDAETRALIPLRKTYWPA